jgi:hypothetical protein
MNGSTVSYILHLSESRWLLGTSIPTLQVGRLAMVDGALKKVSIDFSRKRLRVVIPEHVAADIRVAAAKL